MPEPYILIPDITRNPCWIDTKWMDTGIELSVAILAMLDTTGTQLVPVVRITPYPGLLYSGVKSTEQVQYHARYWNFKFQQWEDAHRRFLTVSDAKKSGSMKINQQIRELRREKYGK